MMKRRKPIRQLDESHLYWLHRQGWELAQGESHGAFRLVHNDGRATREYSLVRDAVAEVKRLDPDVLSRERKQRVRDSFPALSELGWREEREQEASDDV